MTAEDTSTSSPLKESWSRERLMGKSVSFKGLENDQEENEATTGNGGDVTAQQKRRRSKKLEKGEIKMDPMLWGQPGHLTEEEANVYVSTVM